ncbi:hypothetical protein [Terrisporobacter sp.]|uniref:hypothetical protein n=1 Tax=Terrisporobacter sp. TaxID=1965305 RepID=UPI002606A318|nr:hypothetical protein [Terrisporobacter sp.]
MKSVKKNLIFSSVLLGVGIILFIVSLLDILPDGALGSSVFGMGCGFMSAGLVSTIVGYKNYKNPDKVEEIELIENDERNVMLREKTSAKVYSIFTYVQCAIILVASLLGYKGISIVFSILILAELVVWGFLANYYSKNF